MGTIAFLTFLGMAALFTVAYLLYTIQREITLFRKANKRGTGIVSNLLSYINKSIDKKSIPFRVSDMFDLDIDEVGKNMEVTTYEMVNMYEAIDLEGLMESLYVDQEVDYIQKIRSEDYVPIEKGGKERNVKSMYKLTVGKSSLYFYFKYPTSMTIQVGEDENGEPIWENRTVVRTVVTLSDINKDTRLKQKMIKYYIEQNTVKVKPPKNSTDIRVLGNIMGSVTLVNSELLSPYKRNRYYPIRKYPIESIELGTEKVQISTDKLEDFYNDLKELIYGSDTSNILIKGLPGSGKSSLVTSIILNLVTEEREDEREEDLLIVMDTDFKAVAKEIKKDPTFLNRLLPKTKVVYIIDNANEIMNDKSAADMLASLMDGPIAMPNIQFIILINDNLDNVREDLSRTGRIDLTINMKNELSMEELMDLASNIENNLPEHLYLDMNKLQYLPEPRKFSDIFTFVKLKKDSNKKNPFNKYV